MQGPRSATGWLWAGDTEAFREVLGVYLQLQAIATTPPAERVTPCSSGRRSLVTTDRPAEAVGKAARVENRELDQSRRPLAERLEGTRTVIERVHAAGRPRGHVGPFD